MNKPVKKVTVKKYKSPKSLTPTKAKAMPLAALEKRLT